MAGAVREKGGRVSMTTNGVLMDEAAVKKICEAGFDFVAVSLAGASAATHDLLRAGSSLDQICENVARLSGMKSRPGVHLVMQMMKPNIEELPGLVVLAAKLGVDRVIAPNLDYLPVGEMEELKVFGREKDTGLEDIVREALARGKELGVDVRVYPLEPDENVAVCSDDPLHSIVINVWGEVVPCVYLALPLEGDIPRVYMGEKGALGRFVYGKVGNGFKHVLDGMEARSFRDAFERRVEYARLDRIKAMALLALPGIRSVPRSMQKSSEFQVVPLTPSAMPPAPLQCRTCYKLYGI
jgi:MoaA/NifB/PqqE/SkfB family radical SAM enzyme